MKNKQKKNFIGWGVFLVLLVFVYFISVYLSSIYTKYGNEKFIYTLILVFALIIGAAHILLFGLRKVIERDNTFEGKRKKRRLEKYRQIVNYITPFILVAMLYHFWQKGWVALSVVVAILLLERLNELLRKNK